MKKYIAFITVLLCFNSSIFAQEAPKAQPLRIAITGFSPPFVMQSAHHQFYGFDIALMEYICSKLNRPCQYIVLPFNQLIPAIEANQTDLALSAITITPERAKFVRFSIPYMISEAEFIGSEKQPANFSTKQLENKKVGVIKGSVYAIEIQKMDIQSLKMIEYNRNEDVIEAIHTGSLDYALMDAPTARYWKNNSSGKIQTLGKPFLVGFGFGIITNNTNHTLIQDVNLTLMTYQNSDAFKRNYDMYLNNF